jgi:hypothetical protein
LALNNVIAIPDNIYAQEHFHRLFRSVQELDISVLSDWHGYHDPLLGEFWDESVPHMVRSATAVTELTIRSDQAVGAAPAMSFEDMFLPRLSSLVLHQFAFQDDPGTDVVEFILRHKATLARLELHGCSIEGCTHGYFPRPWHAVFALFEAELDVLRDFVFTPDGDFEYTQDDHGCGYERLYDEDAEAVGEGLDGSALESLVAVVASRRECAHLDDDDN